MASPQQTYGRTFAHSLTGSKRHGMSRIMIESNKVSLPAGQTGKTGKTGILKLSLSRARIASPHDTHDTHDMPNMQMSGGGFHSEFESSNDISQRRNGESHHVHNLTHVCIFFKNKRRLFTKKDHLFGVAHQFISLPVRIRNPSRAACW